MKRISSFKNNESTLYIVATPIGNLNEMTPRAIDVLSNVDVIAAEDTRVSRKLLSHFDIKTKMISHHKFNEAASSEGILKLLEDGNDVALVSDGGYPLISDPGYSLVTRAVNMGFNVVPVSGSSALINGLVVSGLATDSFSFVGFLPIKNSDAKAKLRDLYKRKDTLIFYESCHRINKTLKLLLDELGDRHICLCREITKMHEEYIRGNLSTIVSNNLALKGEIVLVVEGNKELKADYLSVDLINLVQKEVDGGKSVSEAIKYIAKEYKVARNHLYKLYHSN